MRAEEEDVDIDGSDEETVAVDQNLKGAENGIGWEEDIRWADEHPDEDNPNWTMRILIKDDD